jgi:acetylornithine/N-succinyldiaminopimelate aminotransferase
MFASGPLNAEADFLTMAKGIAGGFPFGAFAMSEAVAAKLEPGDHGGTYCGNPLGCAVSYAVIKYLIDHDISTEVMKRGGFALERMRKWMRSYPEMIRDVRGRGLLLAIEFCDEKTAGDVTSACLDKRLFVRQTQGNMIRIFPALNITQEEMEEGFMLLEEAIDSTGRKSG